MPQEKLHRALQALEGRREFQDRTQVPPGGIGNSVSRVESRKNGGARPRQRSGRAPPERAYSLVGVVVAHQLRSGRSVRIMIVRLLMQLRLSSLS